MNSIDINTSQNVTIRYDIAGVGDRIIAALLDGLIKGGYILLVYYIAISFDGIYGSWWVVMYAPVAFYSLFFEIMLQGQSPGKRVRKIRVVKLDGSQAGFGEYLIRWLFRIVDISLFSGMVAIIAIVVSKKGQRLGDMLAKTTVIKVQDRVSLKDTLYEKVNDSYLVTYPEVKILESREVELIKQVLNTPQYRDNFDMVYNLTNKIQTKMGVARNEAPEHFLNTVVKDYNYLCDE